MIKPSSGRILALTLCIAVATGFATFTLPGVALQGSLTRLWVNLLYHFLGQSGVPVVLYQNTIIGPKASFEVENNYNGFFLLAAVTCMVAFWPLSIGRRAAWLVGGWIAVALITFLRILSGYLLSAHDPHAAVLVQRCIWPLLIVALLAYAVWCLLRQPSPTKSPSPP